MEKKAENPKEIIRSVRIVHAALCVGVFLMAFVLLLLVLTGLFKSSDNAFSSSWENIPLLVSVAMAVILFAVARQQFSKKVKNIAASSSGVSVKLTGYRYALIRYLALCEGPALFSIILFFVSGDYRLFIIAGVMLAAMLWVAPSVKRIVNDLQLNWQEQQEIE